MRNSNVVFFLLSIPLSILLLRIFISTMLYVIHPSFLICSAHYFMRLILVITLQPFTNDRILLSLLFYTLFSQAEKHEAVLSKLTGMVTGQSRI
jgi:hypothetical protein